MRPIRWLSTKAVNAWYHLGAWLTIALWGMFDERPYSGLHEGLIDARKEAVMVLHGQEYKFPNRAVFPHKPVVFNDLHACEPFRIRQSDPTTCTRPAGHDGPCDGLPGMLCLVWHDGLKKAVPLVDHILVDLPDVYEIPKAKKARKRKAAVTKKRKSTKALAPKRKAKAGAKTVARKKRA